MHHRARSWRTLGIQLVVASIDCRVDALVPGLAWHSLVTSLYRGNLLKAGWAGILTEVSGRDRLDPHIVRAADAGERTGTIDEADLERYEPVVVHVDADNRALAVDNRPEVLVS